MSQKDSNKKWAAKNPEKMKEYRKRWATKNPDYHKKWSAKNPGRRTEISKKWREKHPEKVKDLDLRMKYGIDLKTFKEILEIQKNKCAICERIKKLDVDHCHKTGRIRGLLCRSCNGRLAGLDNPEFFTKAMAYLGKTLEVKNG